MRLNNIIANRGNLARGRRAESTIIANLIIFIAVMGMAAAAVTLFKNILDDSANAASTERQRSVGVMKTSFTIPSAVYNPGTVTVYVKNTGETPFDPEEMDVYIDGLRIPRDINNRTVDVTSDTDLVNTGIWDGGEELEFNIFQTYPVPETHTITVTAPNGVSSEKVFSS